jgi:hypothetical protein
VGRGHAENKRYGHRPKLETPGPDAGLGKRIAWESCFAALAGEPWGLRPWEIRKLTPQQVKTIFFHERDENGQLIIKAEGETFSEEDGFRAKWRARGLTEEQISQKWNEFWILEGYRDSLERQSLPRDEIEAKVNDKGLAMMRQRT